jgi:hypothetical protein
MNKTVFYFYTEPKSHLHLIFKCESKVDNKKMKKKLIDNIAVNVFDKFLAKFKNELIDFNGNFSQFKSFSSDLDEIINPKSPLRPYEINPDVI